MQTVLIKDQVLTHLRMAFLDKTTTLKTKLLPRISMVPITLKLQQIKGQARTPPSKIEQAVTEQHNNRKIVIEIYRLLKQRNRHLKMVILTQIEP